MNLYEFMFFFSALLFSFRKALTAAAHVVHGEAERLVEEKVLDLSQVSLVKVHSFLSTYKYSVIVCNI